MLSPFGVPKNSYKGGQKVLNTNLGKNSNRENNLKRPQITSKEAVIDSFKSTKKSKFKF